MLFIVHRMEFSNQADEMVSIVDWRMVVRLGMKRGSDQPGFDE